MPLTKTSTVLEPEQIAKLRTLSDLWGVSVAQIMREAVHIFLLKYVSKTNVRFTDVLAEHTNTSEPEHEAVA